MASTVRPVRSLLRQAMRTREHAERFQCVLVEASPFFIEVFKPIEVKPAAGVPRKPFKLNDMIPHGHLVRGEITASNHPSSPSHELIVRGS
jgi:hypothetical protein